MYREMLFRRAQQFSEEGFPDVAELLRKYAENGTQDECQALIHMLR